jgi:hypothetical protein
MKKAVSFFVVISIAIVMFTGCASSKSSLKWSSDDPGLKKGTSKESVISKFGQPYRKGTDSNGIEVFEYRKPAEGREAMNSFIAISSFGLVSGKDSSYVDILKVYFSKGKVIKTTYEENVLGVALPGTVSHQTP